MSGFLYFRRWHSPTVFTLVALFFLLPFATVTFLGSCGYSGHGRTSYTGVQLVTHTVPRGTGRGDCSADAINSCVEQAGATPAEIAFAAAVVGLVLGLLGVASGPGYCAAVGVGALLQTYLALSDYEISLHPGYWMALSLFGWAGILHLRRWWARRQIRIGRRGLGYRGRTAVIVGAFLLTFFSLVVGLQFGLWLPSLLFASWAGIRQLTQHGGRPRHDGDP